MSQLVTDNVCFLGCHSTEVIRIPMNTAIAVIIEVVRVVMVVTAVVNRYYHCKSFLSYYQH